MKTLIFSTVLLLFTGAAWAQNPPAPAANQDEPLMEVPERDPAAVRAPEPANPEKGNLPSAADEDQLEVQSQLPEAPLKLDARTMQHEVYRQLYKQEMKEEQRESVDE